MKTIKQLVESLWLPVFLGLIVFVIGITGCLGVLEDFNSWHAMFCGFLAGWYLWLFALNVAERRTPTNSP